MSEIATLEAEAKAKAVKHVANMLKAPDKLEKPAIEVQVPNLTSVTTLSPGSTTEITTITMDATSGEVLSFLGSSSPGHFQNTPVTIAPPAGGQTTTIHLQDLTVSEYTVPHIKEEIVQSDLDEASKRAGTSLEARMMIKSEKERAAFWPERPMKSDASLTTAGVKANTVLTNLQRGNIPTMQTFVVEPVVQTLHQRAGQGELRAKELNPNMIDDRDHRRRTPLMWSSYYGQTPTVNLLLRHGADVHCRGDEDETALHLACSAGHNDVVRILLNHGAEADVLDENSCSALMFAAMQNHALCVNELLNHGADVTLRNINGDSALALAMQNKSLQARAVIEQYVINQMIFNAERKKASAEAMFKMAMHGQLDGVKAGLHQLEKTMSDIQNVHVYMDEIDEALKEVPALEDTLRDLKTETAKYSQLATAKENLKHIFMVPETVKLAHTLISEGKVLEAHRHLVDLENSRDDLLFEIHKLPHNSSTDREILEDYFEPVVELSERMFKDYVKVHLRRTLNIVRTDPKVIVTALRIVEREERADQECLQRQKSTGFLPSGRPKQWKKKGLQVLKTNVQERIEGNQLETKTENKMWLVRHLELIRMITVEDLRIARTLCQPVFPPHYNIFDTYISMYHEALSTRLLEIIANGLEGHEYVTLLSWVIQTYPGKELMADPMLRIPEDKVSPLLDTATLENVQNEYLQNISANYEEWMRNTLSQEVEDWKKEIDPDMDNESCFHTSAPIIIYQMIDENLQVAATISPKLVNKVLVLSMEEVGKYGGMYRLAIVDYKNRYFKDRAQISLFTKYMIAIVNNCERFEELAQELKVRWWKPGFHDQDATNKLEVLLKTFQEMKLETSSYLVDESFLDLDDHFTEILSTKWQNTTDAIDTVCATLDDYFSDYKYLKTKNFESVITLAQDRVARRYITSMLQNNILRRKVTFETSRDRQNAAEKIKNEAIQLKTFFRNVAGDMADFDSPFDALSLLAEVLKSDEELLSLDIGTLVKRYSDITHDQLLCLLLLRGDLSKTVAKEIAQESVPEGVRNRGGTLHAKSILSQVQVTPGLINSLLANKEGAVGTMTNLNPFTNAKDGFKD
ncbi:hypothetical protein TCAL_00416 [Tigriopus californicus]|uniref:Uncharacterized protein n=1 Tax=Tigriopus californicus TaxID=6832 RepID=A0A553NB58_TIGCA|nr:hypothetical protein TCAL_00416 [Tigriopus californicus]